MQLSFHNVKIAWLRWEAQAVSNIVMPFVKEDNY